MGNRVGGGARVPFGATGTTTFTAPAGMTIADFALTRQLTYRNGPPDQGTRRLYAIYKLGGTVFAGAGHYQHATRDRLAAQGSWYGYPEANVVVPRSTVSRASFPALAGYAGDATTLQIAVGCFNGTVDTPCTTAGRRRHLAPAVRGARGPQRPDAPERVDRGDRPAGGRAPRRLRPDHAGRGRQRRDQARRDRRPQRRQRRGRSRGLRRGRAHRHAARRARHACARHARTSRTRRCAPRACRPAGGHSSSASSTPPTTSRSRGPYVVDVATPSDRGPFNGSGATDGGTLTAHFAGGSHRHKTVGYRERATVTGRLLSSAGGPVSGAVLEVLTRDRRSSAQFVSAGPPRRTPTGSTASRCGPPPRGWCRWRGRRTSTTPARRRAPT